MERVKGTIRGIIFIAIAAVVLTASPVPAARRAKPGRKAGVESINGNIVEGFRARNVSRIISCYSERFMSSRYKSLEDRA